MRPVHPNDTMMRTFIARIAEEFRKAYKQFGNLTTLITTNKQSLVHAINEVKNSQLVKSGLVAPIEENWADVPSIGDPDGTGVMNVQAAALAKRTNYLRARTVDNEQAIEALSEAIEDIDSDISTRLSDTTSSTPVGRVQGSWVSVLPQSTPISYGQVTFRHSAANNARAVFDLNNSTGVFSLYSRSTGAVTEMQFDVGNVGDTATSGVVRFFKNTALAAGAPEFEIHAGTSSGPVHMFSTASSGTTYLGKLANQKILVGDPTLSPAAAPLAVEKLAVMGQFTVHGAFKPRSFTKAALPSASTAGLYIEVSDATGGATLARSNGTAWISLITGAAV